MAHRLLIGKGMITLNLKRIFLALTLLPLFAVAADDCALSDPTLTVQAYTVNPQTERVKSKRRLSTVWQILKFLRE
ncbi:hypothetical protein PJ644_004451 [Escherichia coli]|nr:hypothetical protein [Escherichia coli]